MTEKRPTLRGLIRAVRDQTYRVMGRDDQALADFNRALERNPEDASALAGRGETYWAMKRYDQALADLNRALELNPEDASALARRGETYQAMGCHEEALADFNRALELKPDHTWVLLWRFRTYEAMERYEEALADLNRIIELGPGRDYYIKKRAEIQRHIEPAEPTVLQTAPRFTPASRPVAGQLADIRRRSVVGLHFYGLSSGARRDWRRRCGPGPRGGLLGCLARGRERREPGELVEVVAGLGLSRVPLVENLGEIASDH
jgi:tetratricopeptide (TPR) repeat protein